MVAETYQDQMEATRSPFLDCLQSILGRLMPNLLLAEEHAENVLVDGIV
jgi:hypothetical protein